jgi:cell division inhibitor SepF
MGAMRKAGVWLGLVEDEDERGGYGERGGFEDRGYRFNEDFADDDEVDEQAVASTRTRVSERLAAEREARSERAGTVRSITTRSSSPTVSYPTRDNLALAPQMRERPATQAEEDERRYQITTLHPTTYNEARTIGEHFRDSVPVIMNLTEMDEADAKRLVDFAAGLAFGLRGTIERVTNRVFLLSPANVQVTAEDKLKIAEGGFFNQS